jgi:hypothetical protein
MSLRRPLLALFALLPLFGGLVVVAPAVAEEDGFVSLFDGKTLKGWTGATQGYSVENGAIVCQPKGGGNLFTEGEFQDFVLRLEIKIPAGGNNGIGLRTPNAPGDMAYIAMESQVLDDASDKYKNIKPWQHHGSIYGVVPAKPGSLKPAGEWNEEEITLKGRHVRIVVNGQTIVDADLDEASKDGTVDGKKHPGLTNVKGHIGFLGHGSPVEFRNIRIKELK